MSEDAISVNEETTGSADGGSVVRWAVVELMGHTRLGGQISEHQFGGAAMIRLDVPAATGFTTQLLSGASIFRITFCDEITARAAAPGWRPPIYEYELTRELEARGFTVLREPEPTQAALSSAAMDDDDDDPWGGR